jgi:hypothetical protein
MFSPPSSNASDVTSVMWFVRIQNHRLSHMDRRAQNIGGGAKMYRLVIFNCMEKHLTIEVLFTKINRLLDYNEVKES